MTRLDEIKKKMLELEEETPNWKDTTVYVAGFMDGAMWADQHPHWISVEDEMPKENGWYLVCNNIHDYGHCLYEIAEYNARFRSWIWAYTVTHWMPLPQAPVLSKSGNTGKDLKGGEE